MKIKFYQNKCISLLLIVFLQAKKFRRDWITSPSREIADKRRHAEIRRSDNGKGMERIGRSDTRVHHDVLNQNVDDVF